MTSGSAAARVLDLLRARSETLATAESLTGGLIGATLTDVPGASAAYVGGVVTYATHLKAELAGVDQVVLDRNGPVDPVTAMQMAAGVAERCHADWGLAVTGVAGPDPQDGHPVGEVYVAVARRSAVLGEPVRVRSPRGRVEKLTLSGDRSVIRIATVQAALTLLATVLGNADAGSDADSWAGRSDLTGG